MKSPDFQPFDVYAATLDAPTLIEASAGTGKTWAIGGLYVRLILEKELAVENILVVTYTKAATAELGGRIRRKLADMLAELKGQDSGDVFCKTYASRWENDSERAIRRLTQALRCLDDAAIFTIHGFCQRILTEWAFESGMEFDSELLTDERDILGEIIDDFWRREIQPARGRWVDYLVDEGQTPDGWLAEMLPHIGKSDFLALAPLPAVRDLAALEAAADSAYATARALWQASREEVAALLLEHPGLNGNSYRKTSLPGWLAALDAWFAAPGAALSTPEKLAKFTPAELAVGTKKNFTPPDHPFFAQVEILLPALEALKTAFTQKLVALKADLLAWCESELPERKRARRLISYHDLLNRLAQALDGPHGGHLAALVRKRYPAALIDEFQDTDPVQYRIFQRLYASQTAPVFFVGDPKQAIYGFRGADVFTYLEAYRDVARHTTQNVNQRSAAGLIAAVNQLFAASRPFLVDEIGYRPVQASDRDLGRLVVPGEDGAALLFRLLPAGSAKGAEAPLTKDAANVLAVRGVASEIVRLLGSGAHIEKGGESRPLGGGDIAVLVPAHRHGKKVQEELARRGVPSVRYGQDNVFESNEAREMESLLRAVAEPGRDDLVRAALAGEALGGEGAALFELRRDPYAGERLFAAFRRYHEWWREQGFMRFFRAWLDDNRVALRLLRFQDGERRLTNWLHLAELLQVESHTRHGMEALVGWLSRTIRAPRSDQEGALLRLESDAARVRIVTIHASKGLEYPVVFCPFLWDGQIWRKNEGAVTFHDPANGQRPTLDLGSPAYEVNRRSAGVERLAEKLRLLYVALTRAQYRCCVIWGLVKEVETSALAWLLHGPAEEGDDPLAALEAQFGNMTRVRLEEELQGFVARAGGKAALGELTEDDDSHVAPSAQSASLSVRSFTRGLAADWWMTSFSALSQGRHSEAPDYDATPVRQPEAPAQLDIFNFPRGAQAGTCLHAIFEAWDFTRRDDAALLEHAAATLRSHFIDEKWAAVAARTVRATLDAVLDGEGVRMADIAPAHRLVEMGFSYPLGNLDARRFSALLADSDHGCVPEFAAAAVQLDFGRLRGYMMGFIDLVFAAGGRYYIVDYKSNWLGGDLDAYDAPSLTLAMADAHYYLQYLIYCVALHRYLRLRLADYEYERHFGGVVYLFLRGIDPTGRRDTGIFRDRPRAALIEALDRLMAGEMA